MSLFREATHRDTILFVNNLRPSTLEAIETYRLTYDKPVKILILIDQNKKQFLKNIKIYEKNKNVTILKCNTDQPLKIREALAPYIDRLLAVTAQADISIPDLKNVIPHVPYLNSPTQESLEWATDKVLMRRMLRSYNPSISPKYTIVEDNSESSINKIEKKVGYPLIVKPAGLGASLLVSICFHREELDEILLTTFKKLNKIYKEKHGRGKPQILVEQMMEGAMYSIDSYVNSRGNIYHNPPVHVKTGRSIGFDDFFGYQQLTPTKLTKAKIEDANHTVNEAIRALGLRSTSTHAELIKTVKGWKIIEVAPRMGGFRHTLYNWSFGTNHILNDILIRVPQKPVIPKKRKGFTAAFKIYARKEGTLLSVSGVKKVRSLKSYVHLDQDKHKGDNLLFAKHGGDAVLKVILHNKSRSNLLADIRRMEKAIDIKVSPKRRTSK